MVSEYRSGPKQSPIEAAFLKYERAIKRVIGRITKSRDEIEDLAQEAFLRAVIAEKRRPIDNAKAYLFASARNLALTDISKKSRKILQIIEDSTDFDVLDNGPTVDEVIISRERFAMFCEAVALLPPQCRKVFLMCKIYGKTHKEIAKTLRISESTVEKHIGTALARCAAFIRSREDGESASPTVKPVEIRRGL
jgi:RNA polymerase sigma-70 factor (ECF subfamily)